MTLRDVVGDVAQVAAQLLVDAVLVEARGDRGEDAGQRLHRPLELQHLLGQLVDAPRDPGVAAEHLGLDLVDVGDEATHHRRVPVDDGVQDRVQHRLAALVEQVGLALQPAPHPRQVRRLAVPHGDREAGAEEQVQLPELHLLGRVEVPGSLEDDEQGVPVALELRPLVRGDRVLDRQFGQVEQLGELAQLAGLGPVEPHPRQALVVLGQPLVGLGHAAGRGDPPSGGVDGVVDHARAPGLGRQLRGAGHGGALIHARRTTGERAECGQRREATVGHDGLPGSGDDEGAP